MGTLCSSAETPDATAADFRLLFYKVFARKEARIYLNEKTTNMKTETLETVARKLVAPGKGILAADESSGTIEKRLGRRLGTDGVLSKCWSSRGSFPASRWTKAPRPWPIFPAKRSRKVWTDCATD